ncbi:Protein detoxification 34 [Vitis vinifera]|uniref:Protein detoxification 34 n=1 Tax=Vitis vinifera TaxID=29760 RepID=A0A438IYU4_VITVI|nr:Protein detoxification 34 [Vitis vinifera]
MVCGTALQTLILLFIVYRTNWNKEVEQTTERMLKWEGQHIETEKTSDDLDFEFTFFVDEHCINVGLTQPESGGLPPLFVLLEESVQLSWSQTYFSAAQKDVWIGDLGTPLQSLSQTRGDWTIILDKGG